MKEEIITAINAHNLKELERLAAYYTPEKLKELINTSDPVTGKTLLHIAASQGLSDIASYLIKQGAVIDALDNYQNTPLHLCVQATSLSVDKKLTTILQLLQNKANPLLANITDNETSFDGIVKIIAESKESKGSRRVQLNSIISMITPYAKEIAKKAQKAQNVSPNKEVNAAAFYQPPPSVTPGKKVVTGSSITPCTTTKS